MRPEAGRATGYGWCHWLVWCLGGFALLLGQQSGSPAWAQQTRLVDGIAAIVNDEIITITEVREAMGLEAEQVAQQSSGLARDERLRALFKRTLMNLVDAQLQLTQARRLNLRVTEEDVHYQIETLKQQNQLVDEQFLQLLKTRGLTLETYKKQVQEGLLVAKVVNAEVRSRLTVLDSELQAAYKTKQDQYRVGGGQTVSHILFLLPQYPTEQDEQRLRTKADFVLQQLRNGGDFATLARQYSDGPSAEVGGLLGTFRPGELLPGFEETVEQLRPGEISDVVRTRIGFHIIRLEARQTGESRPLAEVQEEIRAEILREKTERKYHDWLESLRQQAYIKILYEG